MFIRLIVLSMFLFATGCQSGIIPCPTVKTARIKKSHPYRPSLSSLSARAEEPDDLHNKSNKINDERSFKNISVEEWDCPRPGEKRYMPKAVKDNIRRNMKRINSGSKVKTDSLRTSR